MPFRLKNIFNFKRPFYERTSDGTHFYYDGRAEWDSVNNKLEYGYTNPILLPILQLISNYVSKVEFKAYKKGSTNEVDHHILTLLNNPNFYQSKQDFLSQFIWLKYCNGYTYIYPIKPVGFENIEDTTEIYNLNVSFVDFGHDFKTRFNFTGDNRDKLEKNTFKYDKQGQNLNISVKEIIPFYDMPNGLYGNLLTAPSRLDAIKEPLSNVKKAFEAKNILLQTNGREMFVNKSSSNLSAMPISQEEKNDIETKLMNNYGLGLNRRRSIISNSDVEWKSLHINLKDLGLEESVIKDAQMIVNSFNISKELISYDGKGAKYENQLQATVGFIQSVIQDNVDDICNSFMSFYNIQDIDLKGTFDHLPIMQIAENKKADTLKKKAEAINTLVNAGYDRDEALNILGM